MDILSTYYKKNGYKKIPFKISKTKHLIVKTKLNNIYARFILDTGASNSCVGSEYEDFFNLITSDSKTTAAGAGAVGMKTKISYGNQLSLSRWKNLNFDIIVFDLSHVNLALKNHNVAPVNGILGADILIKHHAIIDYQNKFLYLK
nr:retropepsin-like aspartic protease [uncultured Flavobacterium sp.]